MKVQFLKNAFERNKKIPSIYRKGMVYDDLSVEDAKFFIDAEKAVEVKDEKPKADKKPKAEDVK